MKFTEDRFLGGGYQFTETGLASMASQLSPGLPSVLSSIKTEGLATDLLNDLLSHKVKEDKNFSSRQLVVNENTEKILGFVGKNYANVDNLPFTHKLESMRLDFDSARIINDSYINISTLDPDNLLTLNREIDGKKDEVRIGLSLRNGMCGESSLAATIFTRRLFCYNGMMISAPKAARRVFHRGQDVLGRLDEVIELTKDQYSIIEDRANALLGMPFEAEKVLKTEWSEVRPEFRHQRFFRPKKHDQERESGLYSNTLNTIRAIPTKFGGEITKKVWGSTFRDQSMFDFVESMTEGIEGKFSSQEVLDIWDSAGKLQNQLVSLN
jgi:hypothetical protein